MSLLFVFASLLSSIWLSKLLSKDPVLLAPALTLLLWSLLLGVFVGNASPIESLWWPFWLLTAASMGGSVWVFRRQWRSLIVFLLPVLCAFVVLAPYLYYGIRSFPGSWFWDGFAYLATAETLWKYPRTISAEGLEPLYLLGQSNFDFRFIGSSIIAVFRGVLPVGGGSDGSVGFFLMACVTAYACSCGYLARQYLPKPMRAPFTAVATVSGPIVNLVWANNFDHLLALSIAPALIGFALELDFRNAGHAVFTGVAGAGMLFIYPEMTPFLLLPAVLILAFRVYRERPLIVKPLAIAASSFALMMFPLASFIHRFMAFQLTTVVRPAGLRPGNGYFPTLLDVRCFYGALSGLYAPFQPCTSGVIDILKLLVGMVVSSAVLVGIFLKRDAIALSAIVICAGVAYFLFGQHYDYAGFKLLTSATPIFALLMFSAFTIERRYVRSIAATSATLLIFFAVLKVYRLNDIVKYKSLEPFAELGSHVPESAIVALKIADPLKFEWATFYLRERQTVPVEGQFIYLKPEAFNQEPFVGRRERITYVLSDTDGPGQVVWENALFRLYRVESPSGPRPSLHSAACQGNARC